MGEIVANLYLENYNDRVLWSAGVKTEDEIRISHPQSVVDTNSTMLVLPESMVHQLGLELNGESVAVYADASKEKLPVAGVVELTLEGRSMNTDIVVGNDEMDALIGQIVLERLDLLADCRMQKFVPRSEDLPIFIFR